MCETTQETNLIHPFVVTLQWEGSSKKVIEIGVILLIALQTLRGNRNIKMLWLFWKHSSLFAGSFEAFIICIQKWFYCYFYSFCASTTKKTNNLAFQCSFNGRQNYYAAIFRCISKFHLSFTHKFPYIKKRVKFWITFCSSTWKYCLLFFTVSFSPELEV